MRFAPQALTLGVLSVLALMLSGETAVLAQSDPGEIHGLKLGLSATAMTLEGWGQLACGSNGGPPRHEINAWSEFGECPAEPNGLHEVTARFDDEEEYVAKALGQPLYPAERSGTRVAGHPVILSALFDDAGTLRAIRMVSDPSATPAERRMAHLLGVAVINRYGPEGWDCTDIPPREGESAVGGVFIKQRCQRATPERIMTVETRFLREPGQHDVDPRTRDYTRGEFESWTRFELYDPAYRAP
jgi:hypothetical protein